MEDIITYTPKEEQTALQLRSQLKELQKLVEELDQQEPRDMDSEAYEAWADMHEELEDMIDEVLDQLDDLE